MGDSLNNDMANSNDNIDNIDMATRSGGWAPPLQARVVAAPIWLPACTLRQSARDERTSSIKRAHSVNRMRTHSSQARTPAHATPPPSTTQPSANRRLISQAPPTHSSANHQLTVLPPTMTTSLFARVRNTCARAAGDVTHALCPLSVAILPSRVIAYLRVRWVRWVCVRWICSEEHTRVQMAWRVSVGWHVQPRTRVSAAPMRLVEQHTERC